jgi:outer membrane protein assembly factor BamD (BamD/ComL family)
MRALLVSIVTLFLVHTIAVADEVDVKALYNEANGLKNKKQYDEAKAKFNAILALNSDDNTTKRYLQATM